MQFIADTLLIAGACGVAFYCFVLSRRLTRFTDLEKGMGGAVAVLSAQVEDLNRALAAAQASADGSGQALQDLTTRAEAVARRLEFSLASLHDVDEPVPSTSPATTPPARSGSGLHDTPSFFASRGAARP